MANRWSARGRAAVVALVALLAGAVGTTNALAVAPATVPTSATTAATTWQFIRYACRTVTAGQVCVAFEGNGQPSTYRVVYVLKPNPGQWIRRAYWTVTYGAADAYTGSPSTLDSAGYRTFCSSTCAEDRTAATYVQPSSIFGVYTFIFSTPQGNFELEAGTTLTTYSSDTLAICGYGEHTYVENFLTTTSDGTVYTGRRFGVDTDRPIQGTLADGNRAIFTKTWPRGTRSVTYVSPTLYRGWTSALTSSTNSGAWRVGLSHSYEFHYSESGTVEHSQTFLGSNGEAC